MRDPARKNEMVISRGSAYIAEGTPLAWKQLTWAQALRHKRAASWEADKVPGRPGRAGAPIFCGPTWLVRDDLIYRDEMSVRVSTVGVVRFTRAVSSEADDVMGSLKLAREVAGELDVPAEYVAVPYTEKAAGMSSAVRMIPNLALEAVLRFAEGGEAGFEGGNADAGTHLVRSFPTRTATLRDVLAEFAQKEHFDKAFLAVRSGSRRLLLRACSKSGKRVAEVANICASGEEAHSAAAVDEFRWLVAAVRSVQSDVLGGILRVSSIPMASYRTEMERRVEERTVTVGGAPRAVRVHRFRFPPYHQHFPGEDPGVALVDGLYDEEDIHTQEELASALFGEYRGATTEMGGLQIPFTKEKYPFTVEFKDAKKTKKGEKPTECVLDDARFKFFLGMRYAWGTGFQQSFTGKRLAESTMTVRFDTEPIPDEWRRFIESHICRETMEALGIDMGDFTLDQVAVNRYMNCHCALASHYDDPRWFQFPIFTQRLFTHARLSYREDGDNNKPFDFYMPLRRGAVLAMLHDEERGSIAGGMRVPSLKGTGGLLARADASRYKHAVQVSDLPDLCPEGGSAALIIRGANPVAMCTRLRHVQHALRSGGATEHETPERLRLERFHLLAALRRHQETSRTGFRVLRDSGAVDEKAVDAVLEHDMSATPGDLSYYVRTVGNEAAPRGKAQELPEDFLRKQAALRPEGRKNYGDIRDAIVETGRVRHSSERFAAVPEVQDIRGGAGGAVRRGREGGAGGRAKRSRME